MKLLNYAGSNWSKWDLHIHSNASDGKGTPKEIVEKAVEKELSVIAVTDHHTVKNLDEVKKLGKENNVTVISGVEFRTEYGARSVHMIGLFPDKYGDTTLDQKTLEQLVLTPLGLSEAHIQMKGREEKPSAKDAEAFKIGMFKLQVDFKKAADLIHEYGGIVSVHAGDKVNSIEEMKHDGTAKKNVKDVVDSLGTVKDELMKSYIDICELGGKGDKNSRFYLKEYAKPSIVASDAHELNDVGRLFTWIKADKNFSGLKQIVYEPNERARVQETMPETKSAYQVIESLEINHKDFGNQSIPFNANMNAIIGGRSSGKSILLGSIAKMANYTGSVKNNNDKYDKYIEEVISCMKLKWKDEADDRNRKVEFFPQSYINGLASDSNEIIQLIEEILKGNHEKKAKFDIYNGQVSKNSVDISNEIENYFKLSYKISDLKKDMESTGDAVGINHEISRLLEDLEKLKKASSSSMTSKDEESYITLKQEKEDITLQIKDMKETELQLEILEKEAITKSVESNMIGFPNDLKEYLVNAFKVLEEEFMQKWSGAIQIKIEELKNAISNREERIAAIMIAEDYCKGEQYYKENIIYTELNAKLEAEKARFSKIEKLEKETKELQEELKKSKEKIIEMQKIYFSLGEDICENVLLEKEDVKILPKTKFEEVRFRNILENSFNRRGQAVSKLLAYEYENIESFEKILDSIFEGLVTGKYTLKNGKELKSVLLEVMSNNYCKIWYDVEYQGDTLSSMSEGKKAFIVLRILLDFNENVCPILIDQPEDDLDNRSIYADLVAYIKSKKKERQIFVVTHNPNVAVGADSEEVIVANQHGVQNENQDGVKFEYLTGSLENSKKFEKGSPILIGQGIREHVCDILEGGDVAFKKRESKYGFGGK